MILERLVSTRFFTNKRCSRFSPRETKLEKSTGKFDLYKIRSEKNRSDIIVLKIELEECELSAGFFYDQIGRLIFLITLKIQLTNHTP